MIDSFDKELLLDRTWESLGKRFPHMESHAFYPCIIERLGVAPSIVYRWKTGESAPSVENIVQICRLCRVSADYLLGLIDAEEEKLRVNMHYAELKRKEYRNEHTVAGRKETSAPADSEADSKAAERV